VPLIRKTGGFTCALDILFLRRDNPGNIVAHGGDIDNRVKTLFDGLRMPETVSDLGGSQLDPQNEDPFYVLLEDDSLITSVSITTDRLLALRESEENLHDVWLVLRVTMVDPSAIFSGRRLI
jgi:hypothetical protein